jgi:hypothetical protein
MENRIRHHTMRKFDESGGSIGAPAGTIAWPLSHDLTVSTVHADDSLQRRPVFPHPPGSELHSPEWSAAETNGIAENTVRWRTKLALGARPVLAVVIKPRQEIVRHLSFTILEDIASRSVLRGHLVSDLPRHHDHDPQTRSGIQNLTIDEFGYPWSAPKPLLSAKVIRLAKLGGAETLRGGAIITVNGAIAQVGMEAVAWSLVLPSPSKQFAGFPRKNGAVSKRCPGDCGKHSLHVPAALCPRAGACADTQSVPTRRCFVGLVS